MTQDTEKLPMAKTPAWQVPSVEGRGAGGIRLQWPKLRGAG